MMSHSYLVQDHIADGRKAFWSVHTGTEKLATQEEFPVVPLLVILVIGLLFFF